MLYLNATPPEAAQGKDVLRLWLSSATFCVWDVGCSCESGAAPSCSARQGAAPSAVGSLSASGWNLAKKKKASPYWAWVICIVLVKGNFPFLLDLATCPGAPRCTLACWGHAPHIARTDGRVGDARESRYVGRVTFDKEWWPQQMVRIFSPGFSIH